MLVRDVINNVSISQFVVYVGTGNNDEICECSNSTIKKYLDYKVERIEPYIDFSINDNSNRGGFQAKIRLVIYKED